MNPWQLRGFLAYRRGQAAQWVTCAALWRLMGKPEFDGLVTELLISPAHARRLAGAYQTYRALRTSTQGRVARSLRAALTIRHFITFGELQRRYEFAPETGLEYLLEAIHLKLPVDEWRQLIEGQEGDNPDAWRAELAKAVTQVDLVSQSYQIPEPIRKLSKLYQRLSNHALNGGLSAYDEYTVELFEILQPKVKHDSP